MGNDMDAYHWLTDPATLGKFIIGVLAVLGILDVVEWFFRKFITWTQKMRLLCRKFVSEPDPRLLND